MWPLPGSRLLEGQCGTPIFPLSLMHFHHFLAPYPPKIIIFAKPASPNNRHLGPFSLLDLRLARSVLNMITKAGSNPAGIHRPSHAVLTKQYLMLIGKHMLIN